MTWGLMQSKFTIKPFQTGEGPIGSALINLTQLSEGLLQTGRIWVYGTGTTLSLIILKPLTCRELMIQYLPKTSMLISPLLTTVAKALHLSVHVPNSQFNCLRNPTSSVLNLATVFRFLNSIATIGMLTVVLSLTKTVLGCTPAMSKDAVQNTRDAITPEEYSCQKSLRGMEWGNPSLKDFSASIKSSFFAEPLPDPPPLSEDPKADFILSRYPDLFKIVWPYKISRIKALLTSHPNQPFVQSVLKGLEFKFWPMSSLPSDRIDNYESHKSCENRSELLKKQSEEEIQAGRYS